ncbi:MAG: Ig-like domain-containing protein, partial [Syntrophorhabdaceae bacterium]
PWNLRDGNNTASVLDKQTDGLTGNAFIIETADDLTNLNLAANGAAGLAASEGLKGDGTLFSSLAQLTASYWTQPCHFVQTKDIAAVSFANPIGDTTAFTGTYNGQDYTVASLTVTANANNTGMFGLFTGDFIRNLNVSALTLTGASLNAGALVGTVNSVATIDNITLNNVDVSNITGAANVAGLIGATNDSTVAVNNVSVIFADGKGIIGTTAAGLIGNAGVATSITNANVTTQGAGTITGEAYASGLVGLFNGTTIDNANVTLSAALSATDDYSFVGGIAGKVSNDSTISNNKVTTTALISANTTGSYAGGIIGYVADADVSVTNNSLTSDLLVSAATSKTAGCIAGNETGLEASLYGLKNATYTTTIDGAIEYPITGNTCTCAQHTHPINAKSNDFMAGKNHTQPLLSSILPHHYPVVTFDIVGDVSVYPQISMTFDKPMNRSSVEDAFELYRYNDAGTEIGAKYNEGFLFAWDTDNQTVHATPKESLDFSCAYAVKVTNAKAKDIFGNTLLRTKNIPPINVDDTNYIIWSFKTNSGTKPSISPITFVRDRRVVDATFAANVSLGSPIYVSKDKFGIYYTTDPNDTNPASWTNKLHNPDNLILKGNLGHNHVTGNDDYTSASINCTLDQLNLTEVNTPYYLTPYVITIDNLIHFGASQTVVVHPWNLRDNNNDPDVLDKQTAGLTTNAFVIETADDLTNLNLADLTSAGLKGDGTLFSSLADLTASYWTQPCHFVQTKDISAVSFASPIGTDTADPFTGSYNGLYYNISGLDVTANANYTGMFGAFAGSSVKNLNISALTLTGASVNTGALVGSVNSNATIANITLNNVNVSGITGGTNVAGLIGVTDDSAVTVNNVSVTFADGKGISGTSAAGLIGTAGDDTSISNAKVTTQGAAGTITGVNYASGLVGLFNGTKIDNANVTLSAELTATANSSFAGGIAGRVSNASTISNNKVTAAALISANTTGSYAGGIVGYAAMPSVNVENNSFNSAVASPNHPVSATTSKTAGCIAGNETGLESSLYGEKNATYSTTIAGAIEYPITGNTCTCGQHIHPINTQSNDFMAGKNHTQPLLSSIMPHHYPVVTYDIVGSISVYPFISMTFDKPMNRSSVEDAFELYKYNDAGTATETQYDKGFLFAWDGDSQTVHATPKESLDFSCAYAVQLSKAKAKDIFGNNLLKTKHIDSIGADSATYVIWSFKTNSGDKPAISPITFIRNRRVVDATFAANVGLGSAIYETAAKFGIYYTTDSADTNPANWTNQLHDTGDLILDVNHVNGNADYETGRINCTLDQDNFKQVNTPYYLTPYVITVDNLIHFGASQTVVVHPWNLRDNNNDPDVLDKQTAGLTTNAFIIETAEDLTNLNLAANGAAGSEGLKGTTSLDDLKAYYWTQDCNFIQTKDIAAVSFANPIGDTTAFTGTYNGQNYNLAGLTITGNAN